jgi:hypothetical protein
VKSWPSESGQNVFTDLDLSTIIFPEGQISQKNLDDLHLHQNRQETSRLKLLNGRAESFVRIAVALFPPVSSPVTSVAHIDFVLYGPRLD